MRTYKKFRLLAGVLSVVLLLAVVPVPAALAAGSAVTVQWNNEKQVMDGLGGAWAFNKGEPLVEFLTKAPGITEGLLDLLFDTEKGIGLDIVRVIVGDGGITNAATGAQWGNRWYDGPSDTIEPEEGQFVWDMPNWEQVKPTFDRGQVFVMQEAQKRGVETFYANAWTAPYWMKKNQSVMGQNANGQAPELREDLDGNGRKKYYQAYADYFVEYALGYKREFGITITHICPVNESEAQHGYSGIVLRGAAYKEFIEEYLGPALKKATDEGRFAALGMAPPLLVGPEATNLSALSQYSATLQNINAETQKHDYINVFSTHVYGSAGTFNNGPATAGVTSGFPAYLRSYGKLWQTEYMTQNNSSSASSANTQVYANQTITDGLYWTRFISNMFTSDPGFNAYLWWWPLGNNGADGSDLIRMATTGSPQGNGDTTTGEVRVFKRFYTFGQISRFIDPGYVRMEATRAPATGVTVIAYKNPANDDFSLVVTNEGADVTLDFTLQDFPAGTDGVVGFRTSASENQKKLAPIAVSGGSFSLDLPAKTVVTLVPVLGEKASLPGLDGWRDIHSSLEAEVNDGTNAALTAENGLVSGLGNNEYLKFANINFADGSANGGIVRRHILSLTAYAASQSGGLIEARVGSPTGKVVGTLLIPAGTGEMKAYTTQIDTGDLGAYGAHVDLYLVARGQDSNLFALDRFEFGETYIAPKTVLTNGGFDTNRATPWVSSGTATLATTNAQNYNAPTVATNTTNAYSLAVSAREAGSGAAQDITGKLTVGETYKLNAFFMAGVASAAAKAELVALDAEGAVVDSTLIAERNDLKAMVWSQLDGSFRYTAPAAEFTKLMLVISDDTDNNFFLEEVTLVPAPNKAMLLTLLAANVSADNYPPATWTAIQEKKAEGWLLVTNENATQAAVDALADALMALYGPVAEVFGFMATTDAALLSAGDFFKVTAGFAQSVSTNATTLTFLYDASKFLYRGFVPGPGVTVVETDNQPGSLTVTLMSEGYDVTSFGEAQFSVRDDVTQVNADYAIAVNADFVYKDMSGNKTTIHASDSVSVTTAGKAGDTNGDGKVTLIDLSNVIDLFGVTSADPLWAQAKFFDFNKNGAIDIGDVTHVAKLIK